MSINGLWLQRTPLFFCVLPLGGQYWGTRWDAIARFWGRVCYSWKYFAMEDNSKTSKFSAGELCFCLLTVCAILLFCVFNAKQIHFLSFSLTSLDLPVYCNKLFHYSCSSITWDRRDNCHRHSSRVSGISVENGMLHVASSMGDFPTSSLHPAPHTEAPTLWEISSEDLYCRTDTS